MCGSVEISREKKGAASLPEEVSKHKYKGSVITKTNKWNSTYNKDNNSELRKLQMVELNILKLFSKLCDENGLRYFLIGGTMLGAVRHHGFIPWDDDVDVGMPRPDYEKFLEISSNELPNGFQILNYRKDEKYLRYFSRLVDNNVKVYNASNTNVIVEPAWVDIFPLDGMPSGKIKQNFHFINMSFFRFWYHASCFEELVNLNRPGRAWYLVLAIRFIQYTHIGRNLNTKKILRIIERKLKHYSYDNSDYMINFFGAYMKKEIVSLSLLKEGTKYPFENLLLTGPEEYNSYLKQFYGDYNVPPKDNQKDKHNIAKVEYLK